MHHRVCYSVGGVLSFVGVVSCVAYGRLAFAATITQ